MRPSEGGLDEMMVHPQNLDMGRYRKLFGAAKFVLRPKTCQLLRCGNAHFTTHPVPPLWEYSRREIYGGQPVGDPTRHGPHQRGSLEFQPISRQAKDHRGLQPVFEPPPQRNGAARCFLAEGGHVGCA
jgi:hypothetical protein